MIFKQLETIINYGNNGCGKTAVSASVLLILEFTVDKKQVRTSADDSNASHFTCKIFVHYFI